MRIRRCSSTWSVAASPAARARSSTGTRARKRHGDGRRRRPSAALCREYKAAFIINDSLELAREVGADGVHLGKADLPCAEARRRAGPDLLIGVSCYDSLQRARQAVRDGASYVAFGSAFASPTKPAAVRADLPLFRQAVNELQIPVVAIGGITPTNASDLVAAGCHALAVISGLFNVPDITATAASVQRPVWIRPGSGSARIVVPTQPHEEPPSDESQ